jgi:hypothetical protein
MAKYCPKECCERYDATIKRLIVSQENKSTSHAAEGNCSAKQEDYHSYTIFSIFTDCRKTLITATEKEAVSCI